MKVNQKNLVILNSICVTSLIISNILASKIVNFWGLVVPAAIVAYPITFLMTDVIGELYGKNEANTTVKLGFVCQIISLLLIGLAILLPVAPFADNQIEFKSILGTSFRVVLASMISYFCSQSWDVFIFHKIKEKSIKHKWLRNNASTITSQLIDTVIFITIAFYGEVPNIITMILSQYLIKVVYALLDTPFFYFFTRKNKADRAKSNKVV